MSNSDIIELPLFLDMNRRLIFIALSVLSCCFLLWGMLTLRSWQPYLFGTKAQLGSIHFSPDGSLLAIRVRMYDYELQRASKRTGYQIWDTSTKRMLWNDERSYTGLFSPDSTLVACVGDVNMVVREAHTGRAKLSIKWPQVTYTKRGAYHSLEQNGVVGWTPDGKGIYARVYERALCLYSLETGKPLRLFNFPIYHSTKLVPLNTMPKNGWFRRVEWFCLSPEGGTMWAVVGVWHHEDGKPSVHPLIPRSITPERAELWECDKNGRLHHPFPLPNYGIPPAGWIEENRSGLTLSRPHSKRGTSTAGRWLATIDTPFLSFAPTPTTITVWEMKTHQRRYVLKVPGGVPSLQFSQDATQLFVTVSTKDNATPPEVRIYDLSTLR